MKIFNFLLILSFSLALNLNCQSKKEDLNDVPPKEDPVIVPHSSPFTLKVNSEGILIRNGKPYYGIGVNYFNAFYRTLQNSSDKSYLEGFKYLSQNKIPFIRFSATGFWPSELKIYTQNRTQYFLLLDEFVKAAETYGIGLIPSLFWNGMTTCDLVGEHRSQWANNNSKTIALMRIFTADIMTRYKDSPAIWGWELGNEYNASSDLLDQAINFLPPVSPSQGTPDKRTVEDIMTSDILHSALAEFVVTARKYDPDVALFSGNAMPATNHYHRYKYKTWTQDSSTDFSAILNVQNPSGLGTITLHPYPSQEFSFFSDYKASLSQMVQEGMRTAKELKMTLFVGEFGSPKTLGTALEAQKFNESLAAIMNNKVQLSAIWVFDLSQQDADWNVTPTNGRKYQLDEIIKANAQLKTAYGL
jgi:hypothetical protein